METILQGILDLGGVSATMVFDASGRLIGHRARAIYDRALCEQVSGTLVKAIDSIQLQQEDWESITAQFADGKVLLRNLGSGPAGAHFVAVVADATLNPSFATVALRVAANKLKKALEGGATSSPPGAAGSGVSGSQALPPSGSQPLGNGQASDSRVLANTGVAWTKGSSSSAMLSGVMAADPASGAFLARAAKEMAKQIGPMSKVYVAEAVRRVCGDTPFAIAQRARLIEDLAGQIEDEADRKEFLQGLEKA